MLGIFICLAFFADLTQRMCTDCVTIFRFLDFGELRSDIYIINNTFLLR